MDQQKFGESVIPWFEEDISSPSTSLPEIIEEVQPITTVVIFVISAIIAITLLFVIAIFIDCRQQKLISMKSHQSRRGTRFRLPKPSKTNEDQQTIVDKMQHSSSSLPSSSDLIV